MAMVQRAVHNDIIIDETKIITLAEFKEEVLKLQRDGWRAIELQVYGKENKLFIRAHKFVKVESSISDAG